jgi:hypothetical protein
MPAKQITVRVPEKLDLKQSQELLAAVLVKAGHPNCFSGFKIAFESAVDPERLVLVTEKDHKSVREAT